MWPSLLDQLTKDDREFLHEFGVPSSVLSNWRKGKRLPTEPQVAALAARLNVDRHELQDEIALMRATPEQRTLLERVMRKSAGAIASIAVMVAVVFGSLTANGPTAFSRSR
jgi:transcriptional regulator with XRE-family HTH domain